METKYCTHVACRARAVQELQWIIHKLPNRTRELCAVVDEIMANPNMEVKCRLVDDSFEKHSGR